jgi:hypothetical protein
MIAYRNIIQISPIRSGSTLVYNILKILFPEKQVIKEHNYEYNADDLFIITIRHPYNSIVSSINRYNLEINDITIQDTIKEYLNNGGNWLIKNSELLLNKNCIVFYYYSFFNNFENIYSVLERRLKIYINASLKKKINDEFNIENVKNNIKKYNKFTEYNVITHFHGKHISQYEGNTNFVDILTKEQIILLQQSQPLNTILYKYFKSPVL